MSDSNMFPLFAPAATVADAIRESAEQRPMHGAYITAITCARDISDIVKALRQTRDRAREMAKDADNSDDDAAACACSGVAAGLNAAIDRLENWLHGNTPGGAIEAAADYSHEDRVQAEYEEDRGY